MATPKKATPANTALTDDEKVAILSAPSWTPEAVGDKMAGIVSNVRMTSRTTEHGFTQYPLITLMDEKGNHHGIHCIGKVLRDRAFELKPRRGDDLTVTYLGKVEPKRGGQAYGNYAMVSSKEELSEMDWSSMAEDDEIPF